jgi:hypothetical protein
MLKTIGRVIILCFILLGALNFYVLNDAAFKTYIKIITTEPVKNIPGGIFHCSVDHHWKIVAMK